MTATTSKRTSTPRTPLVATWHEFWGDHWSEYLDHRGAVARVARAVEAGAVRLGGHQVAVSPFTADRLVASGLPRHRIRVVGNGLTLREFDAAQRSAIRSDIVYVGRLIDEKRVDLLIAAVAQLRDEMPELRCLVIGDGPQRAALEAQVARAGIGSQVRFLGQVEEADKAGLLKASRILVLPSTREGFGIAAIEGHRQRMTGCPAARARDNAARSVSFAACPAENSHTSASASYRNARAVASCSGRSELSPGVSTISTRANIGNG